MLNQLGLLISANTLSYRHRILGSSSGSAVRVNAALVNGEILDLKSLHET